MEAGGGAPGWFVQRMALGWLFPAKANMGRPGVRAEKVLLPQKLRRKEVDSEVQVAWQ